MRSKKPLTGDVILCAMCVGINPQTQDDEYSYRVGYVRDDFLGKIVEPYIHTSSGVCDFCDMDFWQLIEPVKEED